MALINWLVNKIKRTSRTVIVSVCAVAIVIITISGFMYMRNYTYQQAESLLMNGDYADAAQKYQSVIDYKDANEKYVESIYLWAYDSMLSSNYEKALSLLSEILDFENAGEIRDYCDVMVCFNKAEMQISSDDYTGAYNSIKNAPNCLERAELMNVIVEKIDYSRVSETCEGNLYSITGSVKGDDYNVWSGKSHLEVIYGDDAYTYACCRGLSDVERNSVNKGDTITVLGVLASMDVREEGLFAITEYFFTELTGVFFDDCTILSRESLNESRPLSSFYDLSNAVNNG